MFNVWCLCPAWQVLFVLNHNLTPIYEPSPTRNLPQIINISLMSSGHGGFRVGSGQKRKIPEESAEAEDGVQQRRRLGAPTNFSSEENQIKPFLSLPRISICSYNIIRSNYG